MGSRANRPHYPEAGAAAVVMAKDLTPGQALGRTRVVESVEPAPGGRLHVRFVGGLLATYAPTQRLLVYRPVPDWRAIAEQWRALAMAPYSGDADWRMERDELDARWPS